MSIISLTIERPIEIPIDAFESAIEDFLELLIELTPVDTGYCQDSWSIDILTDDYAVLTNSADYASFLDEGWSNQAPNGMTEPALMELPDLFNKNL